MADDDMRILNLPEDWRHAGAHLPGAVPRDPEHPVTGPLPIIRLTPADDLLYRHVVQDWLMELLRGCLVESRHHAVTFAGRTEELTEIGEPHLNSEDGLTIRLAIGQHAFTVRVDPLA